MSIDSTRTRTQLVLLDRDGVINYDSAEYIKSADEWLPIPGALEAIARLNKAGLYTALCSNQAGISRGRLTARDLSAIHLRLSHELASAGGHMSIWRYCPHHPQIKCACRKPNSAMLTDCMSELRITARATVFIGDSLKDMQAAIHAGVKPILVRTSTVNGRPIEQQKQLEADAQSMGVRYVVKDLAEAADLVLLQNGSTQTANL